MEFLGREEELRELRKVREIARKHARFTVVTGRRRVGKTLEGSHGTKINDRLEWYLSCGERLRLFRRELF